MVPIKVAFLWHQHQPFYLSREKGQFLLPWVRLHATKDYLEMAQHLECHPDIRATINLVPSLIEQLGHYENGIPDTLLAICRKPTKDLTDDEEHYIMRECFHADRDRLIARSHRYLELLEMRAFHDNWREQDFRDLIVHYHLAWTGEFEREKEFLSELVAQDRNYTEEQKDLLFAAHALILLKIMPLHNELQSRGQIEISTTPMYHPILPLLCDTTSAREALPHIALPHRAIGNLKSAHAHVAGAVQFHEQCFGTKPTGMWPSEGSISDAALDVMLQYGISWTASDEAVLFNSMNHRANADLPRQYGEFEKYFPRRYEKNGKGITIFFRDHMLSDKIGFDYQKMNADDAVYDFVSHIERIRHEIQYQFGNEVLSQACITVILDGENCWEYYERNGFAFLDKLYTSLATNPHIRTTTFSSYLKECAPSRSLHHIVAGSWIHGDFRIWAGHAEKNQAWDLLSDAWGLAAAEESRTDSPLAKAEGSDWFWWYGDDHTSKQKSVFDELFREHLREVYAAHNAPIPKQLYISIPEQVGTASKAESHYSAMHRAE